MLEKKMMIGAKLFLFFTLLFVFFLLFCFFFFFFVIIAYIWICFRTKMVLFQHEEAKP